MLDTIKSYTKHYIL